MSDYLLGYSHGPNSYPPSFPGIRLIVGVELAYHHRVRRLTIVFYYHVQIICVKSNFNFIHFMDN